MIKNNDNDLPFFAWTKLVIAYNNITPSYAHFVSRKVDITYSHVASINKKLEINGIIYSERVGRIRIIKLTEKGKLIADFLQTRFPELLVWREENE